MKFTISGNEIKIYDFNDLQAYKIARHMEMEGIEFYSILLEKRIDNPDIKEAIEFLIKEEKEHLASFQKKIDEIAAIKEDGFEEEDIEDFLDTHVFPTLNVKKCINEITHNRQEVIKYGIMIENRAIMFYNAILKHTENLEGKDAIRELIQEEREHLIILNKLVS